MGIEWISAPLALRYVAGDDYDLAAKQKVFERAYAGMLAAKAGICIWGDQEFANRAVPHVFWDPGDSSELIEDWDKGDFSRYLKGEMEARLFEVSFDFIALSEIVPTAKQAEAMRRISVAADPDWISARELQRLLQSKHHPAKTEAAIVESCQLGLIAGRAGRMHSESSETGSRMDPTETHSAIEWDIPLWFWRDFVGPDQFHDFGLNKAHGRGSRRRRRFTVQLQGVHFHRSGLVNLGLEPPANAAAPKSKAGRRPKYDWSKATAAIWGQIFRGELLPEKQADVEQALQSQLAEGDEEPSESTVRPYAKDIWEESQKA